MNKNMVGYLVASMFVVVGAIFVWTGIYMAVDNYRFAQTAIPALGTVTKVTSFVSDVPSSKTRTVQQINYNATINFQTNDGRNIDFNPMPSSAYRYVGEKFDILYNPANPNDVRIKTTVGGFALFGVFPIMGVIAVLIGLLIFFAPILKRRQSKWLHQYGTTIAVPVLRIEKQTDKRGVIYAYYVVSQWQNLQDQKIYMFRSDRLDYDPTSYVEGKQISILIDPKNPKKYEIDSATLPKEA